MRMDRHVGVWATPCRTNHHGLIKESMNMFELKCNSSIERKSGLYM